MTIVARFPHIGVCILKDIQNGHHDTSTCEDITPQKAVYTQRFTYFTCNTFKQAQICIERPASEN